MAALQAITHRLPWFVKDPAVALIGEVSQETRSSLNARWEKQIGSDVPQSTVGDSSQDRAFFGRCCTCEPSLGGGDGVDNPSWLELLAARCYLFERLKL